MMEQSRWVDLTQQNPNHSTWYIERFRSMEANGDDLGGEARLAYHGLDRILPGSSDLVPWGGRINLTLRRVTKITRSNATD